MSLTIRVLSIEGNPVDAYLIRIAFDRIRRRAFELVQVASLREGLAQLAEEEHQVVLLDLSLPDARGIAAVQRIREAHPAVPILVFSGLDDENLALRALQAGAQDYLVKGHFDVTMLDSMVLHAIERQRLSLALDRVRRRDIERRDEFLSNVSHELRTPLAAIEQFTSILGDGLMGPLNEQQIECTDVLMRNAKQLRRMVDDLLEVSRVDTDKLRLDRSHVDLGDVIRETLHGLSTKAERRKIKTIVELQDSLPVHADPMRIAQVVANLYENAIKFTPRGGTVWIKASPWVDDRDQVEISIKDTGCGIDATELQSIFERLVQAEGRDSDASRQGLGLGLYISREILNAHEGCLWAESSPGQGSTFRFTLPIWRLERVLLPLVGGNRPAIEPIQLLRVEALCRHDGSDKVPRRARATVNELVRRSAAEAGGVVLPADDGAALVVLPISGTRLPLLVRRLRQRFARHPDVDGRALRLSVQRSPLADPTNIPWGPPASLAAELARRVRLHVSHRPVRDEPQPRQRRQAKGTSSTSTL